MLFQEFLLGFLTIFLWRSELTCVSKTLVDLTHVFDNNTINWFDSEHFFLNATVRSRPGKPWYYQVEVMQEATHGGTHVDAPLHFNPNGWDVSEIPLERLFSVPVALINIERQSALNSSYELAVRDIEDWERRHGRLPDGALLLVRSGWSKFWSNRTAYLGLDEEGVRHFPSIGVEAAQFITKRRDIYGVGLDSVSVDVREPNPVHVMFAEKFMYNIENLADMRRVPAAGAHANVMPMKIAGASGGPARVTVVLP